jgi:hypothetical protein
LICVSGWLRRQRARRQSELKARSVPPFPTAAGTIKSLLEPVLENSNPPSGNQSFPGITTALAQMERLSAAIEHFAGPALAMQRLMEPARVMSEEIEHFTAPMRAAIDKVAAPVLAMEQMTAHVRIMQERTRRMASLRVRRTSQPKPQRRLLRVRHAAARAGGRRPVRVHVHHRTCRASSTARAAPSSDDGSGSDPPPPSHHNAPAAARAVPS